MCTAGYLVDLDKCKHGERGGGGGGKMEQGLGEVHV